MKPLVLVSLMSALVASQAAHADDYAEIDKARATMIAALDKGDSAAFAKLVGESLQTEGVWFDNATCRTKFSDAKLTPKDAKPFVACFKGLGVRAQGLLVHYGPDVTLHAQIKMIDGAPRLVAISGPFATDKTKPYIWEDTFTSHRKPGAAEVVLDAAAQRELGDAGEIGVSFDVCVGPAGKVTSVELAPGMQLDPSGPAMKAVRAATKTWLFEPFLVKGKAATACASELVKLPNKS